MAASFIQEKSQHMFELFDIDRDGAITVEDFRQRADRIVGQFSQADQQKIEAVRQQYAQLWRELADVADADGDGQVTQEEFTVMLDQATPHNVADAVGRKMAEFALADSDGDGYVTKQEMAKLLKGYGVEPNQADTVLAVVDKDGDGRISSQEYTSLLSDVFAGENPKSPGVDLYGRLSGL